MRFVFLLLAVAVFIFSLNAQSEKSKKLNYINGSVSDAITGEGLAGATVIINELKNTGTVTDADGKFRLRVPIGPYSVRISLIGYQAVIKTDVIVNIGRETELNIKLMASTIETKSVTVRGDYFDKAIQANPLSTVVLAAEEIRRSPGSAQDFQRILQGMPGVAFSSDENNELLVRGGSPNENLVVFDDIEVRSVNHYPDEMNSGGPINMVNVDLIQDIQFSTGGYSAKYGDKLSSVVLLNTREGRRCDGIAGNANISMAGAGLILEGGLGGGKGSWLFSGRKSYLDLVVGPIGLTAVPQYYDLQFKGVYDFSKHHKMSVSGIYGNDYIDMEGEPDVTDASKAGVVDSVGVETDLVKQHQYAIGASLKSIWSKSFFSTVTAYFSNYSQDVTVRTDLTRRYFDYKGKMTGSEILDKAIDLDRVFHEGELGLKFDAAWIPGPGYELNFGSAVRTGYYKSTNKIGADSARFFKFNGYSTDTLHVINYASVFDDDYNWFEQSKQDIYINNKLKLFNERLTLNAGLRYDYFSFSDNGCFSPRLSLSYSIVPAQTSLNVAWGYYYQTQAYPTYGDRYGLRINRYLKNTRAVHYIAGLEHILGEGLKLNIEAYYKKYDFIPIDSTFINFNNRTYRSEYRASVGKSYAYGIDMVLQQKLVTDLYGTLTFSYMKSKMEDPRLGRQGSEFSTDYEFPYIFTVIVGKRFLDLRNWLDEQPFYIKYASYILPFSNDMEISFKWRYSSGRAYTPRAYTTLEQHREGGVIWSKGTWYRTDNINSARYPDYHRLDIAFNSRFNFSNWNLVVFLSVQNLYNRENIAHYSYNSDGTRDESHQYGLLPVLGVEVEF